MKIILARCSLSADEALVRYAVRLQQASRLLSRVWASALDNTAEAE